MDLASSRAGAIIALAVFLVVPASITGLQVTYTDTDMDFLQQYSLLVIAFSFLFYFFMVLIPAWAGLYTDRLGSYWFMMLIFMYLLWSTLLYTLSTVIWSYIVIVLTLIFLIFMIRPLYRYAHPGFFAMYLVACLWVLTIVVLETVFIFRRQVSSSSSTDSSAESSDDHVSSDPSEQSSESSSSS